MGILSRVKRYTLKKSEKRKMKLKKYCMEMLTVKSKYSSEFYLKNEDGKFFVCEQKYRSYKIPGYQYITEEVPVKLKKILEIKKEDKNYYFFKFVYYIQLILNKGNEYKLENYNELAIRNDIKKMKKKIRKLKKEIDKESDFFPEENERIIKIKERIEKKINEIKILEKKLFRMGKIKKKEKEILFEKIEKNYENFKKEKKENNDMMNFYNYVDKILYKNYFYFSIIKK